MAVIRRLAAICFVIGVGAALSAAQQQPFRTATRLVEVQVVVTDGSKKPVAGLTREDFAIKEDGVLQAVSIFEVRDTRAPVPTASAPPATSEEGITVSNHALNVSGSRVVLILDRMNAAFDSQWFARKHIDAHLSRMRAGDTVALYVLDGGMRVLHDFSDDAASLRRALDLYQARVTGVYDASMEPPADLGDDTATVWIVDPSTAVSEFFTRQRWRNTFLSLQALARHLSGVAGRKNVVWVSEVFPIPIKEGRLEFLEEMRKTTRALNDAQASLYPVDARGLVGAITYSAGRPRFTTFSQIRGNMDTMEVVAEDTGGRAFVNTNALDVSIARAVEDSRLVYVLGYYSTDPKADGRFRAIRVEVKKKGLAVRHRGGYVAAAPVLDRKSRDAALRDALEGPLAATQIGLSAGLEYDKADSTATIRLRVDPSTVTQAETPGSVDVLVAEISRTGRGSIVQRATASMDALPLELTVRVTQYMHELRIVARDPVSGRVGSLVIPARTLFR